MDIDKAKEGARSLSKNYSPVLATILLQIIQADPNWGFLVGLVIASVHSHWDLTEDRGKELLEFIRNNRPKISGEIVSTSEYKAAVTSIWERYIRENSSRKRKQLRKFLLGLGQGAKIEDHLYDKIYIVIENLTDIEAEVFGLIVRHTEHYIPADSIDIEVNEMQALKQYSKEVLRDVFLSLHTYRLITITEPQIGFIRIKQLTKLGRTFYNLVIDDSTV